MHVERSVSRESLDHGGIQRVTCSGEIAGGITAWEAAKLPVQAGSA